jgi:hypothetical protein
MSCAGLAKTIQKDCARSAGRLLRVAYQRLAWTGLTTRSLHGASLCYIRTVTFTRGEKIVEHSQAYLEIGIRRICEQMPAQSLHHGHYPLGEFYARRSEVKSPGALIIRIRAANYKTTGAQLIQQPHQTRPFDVHLLGERVLAQTVVMPDAHERRRDGAGESERGELVVVAAAQLLSERTERRDESRLEGVARGRRAFTGVHRIR